jgi:hypothetical protein
MKYCSGLDAGTGTAAETADNPALNAMALDAVSFDTMSLETMSLDTAADVLSSFTSKENACGVLDGVCAPMSSTENDPSKASAVASPFTPSGILSLPWPRIH